MLKSLSKLFYPTVGDRIGRVEYMKLIILYNFLLPIVWMIILALIIGFFLISIFLINLYYNGISDDIMHYAVNLIIVIGILLLIINIANIILIYAKRLNDFNFSGFWLLLVLIPLFGIIIAILAQLFIFPMIRGSKGENKYGTNDYVIKKNDYIYALLYYSIYFTSMIIAVFFRDLVPA